MQLMIDLETLSLRSDAAVVSLGFAYFDERGVVETGGYQFRPADWTGDIDPSTVRWWMNQSEAARQATFNGTHIAKTAALDLRHGLELAKPTAVWANDPSFDIVVLKHWWQRFVGALEFPISYKVERSCRTIFDLAKQYGIDYSRAWHGALEHDAVSDAACQARAVLLVQNEIQHRMGGTNELTFGGGCSGNAG